MSADLAYPSWLKGQDTTLAATLGEASRAFITLSATDGVDTTVTTEWSYTLMLTAERVEELEIEAFLQARLRRRRIPPWVSAVATIVGLVAVWAFINCIGWH